MTVRIGTFFFFILKIANITIKTRFFLYFFLEIFKKEKKVSQKNLDRVGLP